MKLFFLLILVLLPVLGQEHHHFHTEAGAGVELETERFFLASLLEREGDKINPSVEGGVKIKRFEFFGGVPFRAGVKVPIWKDVFKFVTVVEHHRVLAGISFLMKEKEEFMVVVNHETIKAAFIFHFHIKK